MAQTVLLLGAITNEKTVKLIQQLPTLLPGIPPLQFQGESTSFTCVSLIGVFFPQTSRSNTNLTALINLCFVPKSQIKCNWPDQCIWPIAM